MDSSQHLIFVYVFIKCKFLRDLFGTNNSDPDHKLSRERFFNHFYSNLDYFIKIDILISIMILLLGIEQLLIKANTLQEFTDSTFKRSELGSVSNLSIIVIAILWKLDIVTISS